MNLDPAPSGRTQNSRNEFRYYASSTAARIGGAQFCACTRGDDTLNGRMTFLILFAVQLATLAAGFVFLTRRIDLLQHEVAQLRQALEGRRAARPKLVASNSRAVSTSVDAPLLRPEKAWRKPASAPPRLSVLAQWCVTAALIAAPAGAFALAAEPIAVICAGVLLSALALLLALRPNWSAVAWCGVLGAAAWAIAGIAIGAAQSQAGLYSAFVACAACAGLASAILNRLAPGAVMMAAMGGASLTLAAQTSAISSPGAAFGAVVVAAAIAGASRLRLEALHIGAFVALLGGLFVVSGQPTAAVWFTPIATWAGALFLAIAVVRVPQLGARGVTIAATGALAPFAAIAALHGGGQGLSDPLAASGAFLSLALMLVGVAWLAAERRQEGFAGLKLNAWVLSASVGAALIAAILVGANPAPAAILLMFAAATCALLNRRFPAPYWRVGAGAFGLCACAYAWTCAAGILGETMPAWQTLAAALAAPAALAFGAARSFGRGHALSSAIMDLAGVALALAGLLIGARLALSAGAPMSYEFGVEELSVQTCIWLAAGLAMAVADGKVVHAALSRVLTAIGVCSAALLSGLWFAAYFVTPSATLENFNFILFAGPAILFAVHWIMWRAKRAPLLARANLGASAFLAASALTAEVLKARIDASGGDWVSAATAATAFSLALAVNFAPGAAGARRPRWVRAPRQAA